MADAAPVYGQLLDSLVEQHSDVSDFSACRSTEEILAALEDLIDQGELLLEEAAEILNDLTGRTFAK